MSSSNTPNPFASWVSHSDLFTPYVYELVKDPRVVDAQLECRKTMDGTFYYNYKLSSTSAPEHILHSSRSSTKAAVSKKTLSVSTEIQKSSDLSTEIPIAVKSLSMNPSDNLVSNPKPLDIKFTLLTKDGTRSFHLDNGLNGPYTLRDLLLHFHENVIGDTKDDFCPRFAMIFDKKVAPIRHEDLEMRIDQFPAEVIEIVANTM